MFNAGLKWMFLKLHWNDNRRWLCIWKAIMAVFWANESGLAILLFALFFTICLL